MSSAPQNQPATPAPSSASDEAFLRDTLKRCSPATNEAAIAYRQTKDPIHLSPIVLGIIARFLDPSAAAQLADPDDDLRIMEDLGLDSLTLMEAIVLIEDVLQISIQNDELRRLRTVGDIRGFILHKAQGLPPPQPSKFVSPEEIHAIMPHQSPFLFVEEANISTASASGVYRVVGDEVFLEGHFKDNPVFPASLMLEALGQLAVLFLLQAENPDLDGKVDAKTIFFTGCDGVRCHRICRPGDVLKLSVKPKRLRMPIATFEGSIRVGQDKAALAEEINLTFGYLPESAQSVDKDEQESTD